MKLEYPKEWFERSAEIEGPAEVGAGCPAVAGSPSSDSPPTPHPSGAWDRSDFIRHTAKLEAALLEIAKQKLASEMDDQSAECADWEGGYEAIVTIARAALGLLENR